MTLPAKLTSWATVASKNASPIQIAERAIATPKPLPLNKVVNQFKPAQLIIYAPAGKSPFKGCSPKEVTDVVNRALASIEASLEGNPI
ncbi:hypothetical protein CROQUDRAFT_703538 [Cronartium quercuum f. sp. fusiforme G11]|uniref:Uncharacterized protein n=1 Tax=Cronartium quercuum f. sp. fusiforme G11 TaxID=708437 RepID=A0A9P6N7E1_9BASI|nr:hypothetical protein CROQUDRAFT_703538 [Cronartium quercuum f. sp. fusiforme G11]